MAVEERRSEVKHEMHLDRKKPTLHWSDLAALRGIQGEAEQSEMSNVGPSAFVPWVLCYLCPAMHPPVAYISKMEPAEPTFSICLC